jgi:deazaflavin-dependent oxidoreductase (nitroreductase family)
MPIPEFDALRHENVLYLTTVGRNTGKPRTIEIWFVSYKERLYLLAEHGLKAQWVRNIQANPEVRMQIAQHRFLAHGHILDDARDRQEWQAVAPSHAENTVGATACQSPSPRVGSRNWRIAQLDYVHSCRRTEGSSQAVQHCTGDFHDGGFRR